MADFEVVPLFGRFWLLVGWLRARMVACILVIHHGVMVLVR